MTHDELLEKIDYFVQINKSPDGTMGIANWTEPAKALHAVVELHKPQLDHCPCCPPVLCECAEVYPCPTIQAIEKELNNG